MRFVQGIDYGPRAGTLGFVVHMAEGGDGTLQYLARRNGESNYQWRTRVRGVSANFVILSTGEVVQMVGWDRASGSLNPSDRGKTTGFYNTGVIQSILGSKYVDPNAWSLSVEVTGYRSNGPNRAQVEALVALVAEARDRYPTMRGAYGHADQTSTKGCPGTAPLMMEVWRRIGHGLFTSTQTQQEYTMPAFTVVNNLPTGTLTIKAGQTGVMYLRLRDGKLLAVDPAKFGAKRPILPVRLAAPIIAGKPLTDDWTLGYIVGDDAAFVLARNVTVTPDQSQELAEAKATISAQAATIATLKTDVAEANALKGALKAFID